MTTRQQGEKVTLTATITDTDGVATDPATIKISIKDPAQTVTVDAEDMTKSTTGIYTYDYVLPTGATQVGIFSVKIVATNADGDSTIKNHSINVEESF